MTRRHGRRASSRARELAGVAQGEEPIDFFGRDEDRTRNGYVGTAVVVCYMMGVAGLRKDAVLASAPGVLELIASNGITHMFEQGQPPGHEEPLFDAIGPLEAGKRADFVILDRNLLENPEDDIVDTRVLRTVVDGKVVYTGE